MKERLTEFLSYLGIGQNKFEERVGIARGYVNKMSGNMTMKILDKISAVYPELNTNWLKTGEGEMLKPVGQTVKIGRDNNGIGSIGNLNGDMQIHQGSETGKLIDNHDKQSDRFTQILITEINSFRKYMERQHEYVSRQDSYIEKTIENAHLGNEQHLQRIDKLISQQNALIEMLGGQCKSMHEQNDRLLNLLEKKL